MNRTAFPSPQEPSLGSTSPKTTWTDLQRELISADLGPAPEPEMEDLGAPKAERKSFSLLANSPGAQSTYRPTLNAIGRLLLTAYHGTTLGVGRSVLVKIVGDILLEKFDYRGQALELTIQSGMSGFSICVGTEGALLGLAVWDIRHVEPYREVLSFNWGTEQESCDWSEFEKFSAFIAGVLEAPTCVQGRMTESWERNQPDFLSAK